MKRAPFGRRWMWIFLGAGTYGLHLALGKDSTLVEKVFSRGFFVGLRRAWDGTLGLSPVPLLYFLTAGAVLWAVWIILKLFSKKARRPSSSVRSRIGRAAFAVASWAGIFVFFFYVLWGFHYNRIGLEKQLRLEVVPLDLAAVKAEAEEAVRRLTESRDSISGATPAALKAADLPPGLESSIRAGLSKALRDAGYPAPGRPRIRPLRPGSLLMRFSSTGFYFPYLGEGYIAANLTAAERPFVIAHEMTHAYGLTDEGEANLLAYLVCASSKEPVIRYSGHLSYFGYLLSDYARLSRDDAREIAARLPAGVRADIRAARDQWDRYRGPVRAAAEAVYGRYLKSQGIKEGLRSYDRLVSLVAAWRREGPRR